jgi:uncharacterized protein YdiU (UPF0061 family)
VEPLGYSFNNSLVQHPAADIIVLALIAANDENTTPMKNLIKVLEKPYTNQENISDFQLPNPLENRKYQTFCGT